MRVDPGPCPLKLSFEGRPVPARPGETLAAALTAAGELVLRLTRGGAGRGLFCGMGVCQDCLVEVDGVPNRRACMTRIEGPHTIRRQQSPAAAPATVGPLPPAALATPELLVVGGGAGGLAAAAVAAEAGAEVVLLDERPQPGGQYYKQPSASRGAIARPDAQFAGGRALIERARRAGVRLVSGAQAWGAFAAPLEVAAVTPEGAAVYRPRRLVIATGAYERGLPVPGWTLPGVMTTGAAQTLLRSYGVLPGRRVLVAGNGPLNLQVALELARAGAEIVALAELARGARTGRRRRALAHGVEHAGPARRRAPLPACAAQPRRPAPLRPRAGAGRARAAGLAGASWGWARGALRGGRRLHGLRLPARERAAARARLPARFRPGARASRHCTRRGVRNERRRRLRRRRLLRPRRGAGRRWRRA